MRKANEHGAAGRFDAAVREAARVDRAPTDLRALTVIARAQTAAGNLEAADRAWAQVARRDPNNWRVHYEWARAVAILGGPPERRDAAFARAVELNPRLAPAPE